MLNRTVIAVFVLLLGAVPTQAQEKAKSATDVVALLEKSGYAYTRVSDGVWGIGGTGKNLKDTFRYQSVHPANDLRVKWCVAIAFEFQQHHF